MATIAAVGLGLTAGYTTSIVSSSCLWSVMISHLTRFTLPTQSISSMKNIYRVPTLSPRDRLHLWSLTFDSGAALMRPLIPLLTTLLATSAYYATKPALYVPHNWIASQRRAVLAVSAALTLFNFPWTFLTILPIVKKLKVIEAKIVKGQSPDEEDKSLQRSARTDLSFGASPAESKDGDAISTGDTDYDIQSWTKLHHVRSLACTLAFTLSVLELVSA
ncbi:BQ5605_C016g08117 [Microbotryum silenes-dioicae]|uniref:BQ5605_C016g08117 protein n=1 Tax=Microbotryum silenes-dioicae TaxID=796604 RepID=A0A2X0MH37_9BASI|nr:BQ5605_C016g08117 [Microbotryum silenes-dioicae]